MKRISSRGTWVMKTALPMFTFLLMLVILAGAIWGVETGRAQWTFLVLAGCLFIVITVAAMFLRAAVADAVYDGGHFLLVELGDIKDAIPFKGIKRVRYVSFRSVTCIWVCPDGPSPFGHAVKFYPPFSLLGGKGVKLYRDLAARAAEARGDEAGWADARDVSDPRVKY